MINTKYVLSAALLISALGFSRLSSCMENEKGGLADIGSLKNDSPHVFQFKVTESPTDSELYNLETEKSGSSENKREETDSNPLQQQESNQDQQEQDRNQQKELQRSGSRQPSQQSMPTQGRQGQDQQQLSGSSNGGTSPGYKWLLENAKHTYNDHATAFNRGGVGIAVIGVAAIAFMRGKKLKLW